MVVVFVSCNNSIKVNYKKQDLTFFDSIAAKNNLSIEQVKKHLIIDSSFFTNRSHFVGDTIYYPNSNPKLIILTCDNNRTCLEKYLLVYKVNSVKTASFLMVETDCDIDYGTDYNKLDFAIFNNRQFYTRDIWYKVGNSSKVKIEKTDQFYQIDVSGKIDSLKKKPAGVVLPKFVPIDVKDD